MRFVILKAQPCVACAQGCGFAEMMEATCSRGSLQTKAALDYSSADERYIPTGHDLL